MNKQNIEEFVKGWVVGNFVPSIFKTNEVEVGAKFFKIGESEPSHKQLVATEITIVMDGKIRMNNEYFNSGDVITIPPGEFADFEALTDAKLICIKFPSIPSDRVLE